MSALGFFFRVVVGVDAICVVRVWGGVVVGSQSPAATSRRPGRWGELSTELIVDEAMVLAAEHGLAGVTMRRLADRLGVQAMSLYHHVANRAGLLGLMADRSVAVILSDNDTDVDGPWDERLLQLSTRIYRAAVVNPALVEVMISARLPTQPHATAQAQPREWDRWLEVLDRMAHLLRQAPIPMPQVPELLYTLVSLLIGLAARAASTRPTLPGHAQYAEDALMLVLETLPADGTQTARGEIKQ